MAFQGKIGQVGGVGGLAARGRDVVDAGRKHGATFFVFLSILLFLFDVTIGYKGFDIVKIGSFFEILKFVSSLAYVIAVWALFYYFTLKERNVKALVTSIIALIVVIFSLAMVFKYDRIIILHVIFILIFWVGFIKSREDAATANVLLIALLIADLYLFSILNAFSPNVAGILQGFPFLFILTMLFVLEQTNNIFALICIIFVVLWYFFTAGPELAEHFGLADIEAIKTKLPPWKELVEQAKKRLVENPFKKIKAGIDSWLSERIQYAVTGKVEENKVEPLGVYLENVQPADKKYYEDENVIVWGTVIARTLDDPINIKVGCYVKDGEKKKIADKIDPNKSFSVFTLEEQDFACTFGSCKNADIGKDLRCKNFCNPQKDTGCKTVVDRKILKIGENTITTFADFNFETLAYQKVYFINKERQRAMARERLDPFEEFAITDKNPIAVYTNGPAKIEMGTNSPLIGVSDQYIVQPSLDISIANREGWQGKIKKLKEVVIFLPEGMTIDTDPKDGATPSCNEKVVSYDKNQCKTDSCEKIVKKECLEVCQGYVVGSRAYNSCEGECNENFEKCQKSCDYFFQEGEQKYNGYRLDPLILRDKEFEDGLAFRCRFKPTENLLGNSPFTTKSFRVKVRYNYTVEKSVSVNIEQIPGKAAINTPPLSQGIISCPIENPTISCGSLGSGNPTCEHCSESYRQSNPGLCDTFPRTADGIDVKGPDGLDTYSATLPYIHGQDVQWNYESVQDGASGLGYGKTFTATEGTDTYQMYMTHLDPDGPGSVGDLFPSGTSAGNLYDDIDGEGKGHTHIQIIKNGERVRKPEIELGMCSSAFGTANDVEGFFNVLRGSSYFSDFTDAFLWGLTANAWYESTFRADANGDKDSTSPIDERAIQVGNEYYCSFGYWQLNVCGGGGMDFINFHHLDVDNKQEVYAAITDRDKQFLYVAEKMKVLFPGEYDDESLSAEYLAEQIAIRFERCEGCKEGESETIARGNLAAEYWENYGMA